LKIIIERLKWYCRTISVLLILALTVRGGERHEIAIPDIPGYTILKCDLHMHTVFSDGVVWPTVRVEEAWEDGLDAIAITDHMSTNHIRSIV
jgi:hypothetical protein